jgi:pSer/pThr/pTyr-binding forkhead associated (FHA) protein
MRPQVKLVVKNGSLAGREYVFHRRRLWRVGRADDCDLCLPPGLEYKTVSRHHCLLDIDPPRLRVRDLGSRNGTFINGIRLGPLFHCPRANRPGAMFSNDYDLHDGDELRLGCLALAVCVTGAGSERMPLPDAPPDSAEILVDNEFAEPGPEGCSEYCHPPLYV